MNKDRLPWNNLHRRRFFAQNSNLHGNCRIRCRNDQRIIRCRGRHDPCAAAGMADRVERRGNISCIHLHHFAHLHHFFGHTCRWHTSLEGCSAIFDRQHDWRIGSRYLGQSNTRIVATQGFGTDDPLGWGSIFMVTGFPLLIGCILGFLSGLGTGGGSLLILWLTLVLQMPAEEARLINLMFFLPSSLIACVFRRNQGRLEIKKVLPAIVAGIIGAAIGARIGGWIDTSLLKKLFGGLLLLSGLREILYRSKSN